MKKLTPSEQRLAGFGPTALAVKLALAYLNENRKGAGLKPLDRIDPEWWEMYGDKWIAEAKAKSK